MINSTNTVNIDGNVIDQEELASILKMDNNDRFTRWVVRPLALLTAIGMGVAMVFASVFIMLLSLATLPLLAVSLWAMKTKLKRDYDNSEADTVAQV